MAERRLSPPNPNEVTIAKSFRRALMFFRVFIMTRFADDVSHRTFYSWKWRKLPQTPANVTRSLNRPTVKCSQSVLVLIYSTYVLLPRGEKTHRSPPRNKISSILNEVSTLAAGIVECISTLFLRWSWPCVKHQYRIGMSVGSPSTHLMFLSLELVVVIELSIQLSVVSALRVWLGISSI